MMIRPRRHVACFSAALIASTLASAAPAQRTAPPGNPAAPLARPDVPRGSGSPTLVVEPVAMAIAAFDANADGRVTRAELADGVRHSFEVIDTTHRGRLSYIDYSDWAERWLGDRNALPSPFELDADGDNAITLAEMEARFDAIFTRLDTNKDGILTRAELVTVRATPTSGFGEDRRGRHGRRGQGEP